MVETGGLENRCAGNRTGGSNPSPSAIFFVVVVLRLRSGFRVTALAALTPSVPLKFESLSLRHSSFSGPFEDHVEGLSVCGPDMHSRRNCIQR